MMNNVAQAQQDERVVYKEEGALGQYVELLVTGELDEYMLQAIEAFVKRQRDRLAHPGEPSKKPDVVKSRSSVAQERVVPYSDIQGFSANKEFGSNKNNRGKK